MWKITFLAIMRFDNFSQILTEARLSLENKVLEGRIVKLKHTAELDFLQQICVLIPNDLLNAVNLYHPPFLFLRLWWNETDPSTYIQQRCQDIDQMIERILFWYDQKFPSQTETNEGEIKLLLEIKEFFINLKLKNDQLLSSLSATKHSYSQNRFCCCSNCICSGGICWDTCWESTFYCYYYSFLLHFPKSQSPDSKFLLNDQYEGPYGKGEARKYYFALPCERKDPEQQKLNQNQHHHSSGCCSNCSCNCDGCCRCCTDCCWYSTSPTYYDSHCHHHHHNSPYSHDHYYYYHHHHHHHDICCRECLVPTGVLETCQDCWKGCCSGLLECFSISIEGFADCCGHCSHFLVAIFSNGCRQCPDCNCNCLEHCKCERCDCPVKDDCLSGVMSVFGGIGAAIAFIFDATSGKESDNSTSPITNTTNSSTSRYLFEDEFDPSSRRLDSQTSSQYTPSIVFMVFALIIFLPRILPNLFYVLLNLSQGISVNHSLKSLGALIGLGVPLALILAILGGASRWTYVSLLLLSMHAMYALYSLQRKKIDPYLMDLSFLSCSEWREYQMKSGSQYLDDIVHTLVKYKETFRKDSNDLKQSIPILVFIKVIWSTVDKAYIRWNRRAEILSSHRLDSATLQQRYGKKAPIEDYQKTLPVAQLVIPNQSIPAAGNQERPISPHDRL